MSDIVATTTLDASPFSRELQSLLRESRVAGRSLGRNLTVDLGPVTRQVAQLQRQLQRGFTSRQNPLASLERARSSARQVDALTASIQANAVQTRNLILQHERGEVSAQSFIAQMNILRSVASSLAVGLDQDFKALTTVEQTLKRADAAVASANRSLDEGVRAAERYAAIATNLRRAIEARVISEEQGIVLTRRYAQEAREAAAGTEQWSDTQNSLLNSAATLERTLATLEGRTTRLGLSQNQAIGTTEALAGSFRGLQSVIAAVAGGAGFGAVIRFTNASAQASAEARIQTELFYELLEGRVSEERATAFLQRLAAEFRTTTAAVAAGAVPLVRYGATLEQVEFIMQRGGASALAYGRDASAGFENVAQALQSETSQALNRIGVAGDLGPALQREARARGVTVDALTREQKAQALVNLLLNETTEEYEALPRVLSGYIGSLSEATATNDLFRRSLGTGFQVVFTPFIRGFTLLQRLFLALPVSVQTLVGIFTALAAIVATLVGGYALLNSALVREQVIARSVQALLQNELVLRSRLGQTLLALAGRYKLLGEAQLAQAAAARTAATANAAAGASTVALGGVLTRSLALLRAFVTGLARFSLNPVVLALTAGVAVFKLFEVAVARNRSVLEPAMRVWTASAGTLRTALSNVGDAFQRLTGVSVTWGELANRTLVFVAAQLAEMLLFAANNAEKLAIGIQFLSTFGQNPAEAIREYNAAMADLTERTRAARADIVVAAEAALAGAPAYDEAAEAAARDAAAMAELRTEAENLLKSLTDKVVDLQIDLEGTDLQKQLQGIKRQFQGFYEDLDEIVARGGSNPFVRELADQLRERLEGLEDLARDQLIARTIGAFEEEIAQAQLDAIQDGTAKINAEYDRRAAETQRAYGDVLSSLEAGGAEYERVLELLNERLAQLESARTRDLQAEAERQLRAAQALARQIRQIENDLARTDIGFIGSDTQRVQAEFDQNAREIQQRYEQMLADIQGADEASVQARIRLQQLLTAELLQNEEQRRRATEQSARERIEASLQAEARARDLELQLAQSRSQDRRQQAQIELERQLADIAEFERQALAQAEGNADAIAAAEREAGLRRQLARQQFADAVVAIERDAAERVRALQEQAAQAEANLQVQRLQFAGQDRQAVEAQYEIQVRAAVAAFEKVRDARETTNAEMLAAEQHLNAALAQAAFERQRALTAIDLEGVEQRVQDVQRAFARGVLDRQNQDDLQEAIATVTDLRDSLVNVAGAQDAVARLSTVIEDLTDELTDLTGLEPNLKRAADLLNQLDGQGIENRRAEIELIEDTGDRLRARYALEADLRARELATFERTVAERVQNEELAARLIAERRESARQTETLAEQQLTRDLEAEYRRRAQATARTLLDAGAELERARISLLGNEVGRSQATFALERRLRQEAQRQQLEDFEGSLREREQLLRDFQATELALAEQQGRDVAKLQDEAARRYAESVERAYGQASSEVGDEIRRIAGKVTEGVEYLSQQGLEAVISNLEGAVANLRASGVAEDALEPFVEATREAGRNLETFLERQASQQAAAVAVNREYAASLLEAASAQEALERRGGRQAQAQAFQTYLNQLQEEIRLTAQATQYARERGAANRELVPLLERQAQAQRGAIGAIQQQIQALRAQRDAQAGILGTGRSVLDYYRTLNKLGGRQGFRENQAELRRALEQQRDLAADLLRQSIKQNRPIEERLKLAQELLKLEEEVGEAGGRALRQGDMRTLLEDARKQLTRFPADGRKAVLTIEDLDRQIASLDKTLQTSVESLGTISSELSGALGSIFEPADIPQADIQAIAADFRKRLEPLLAEAADELGKVVGEGFAEAVTDGVSGADVAGPLADTILGADPTAHARNMGLTAGRGLMDAFAQGITQNEGRLLSAVETVLQKVRDMLPSSPAKRGPLSDIDVSGRRFVTTWGGNAVKEMQVFTRQFEASLGGLLPSARSLSVRTLPAMAGAGGIGAINNYFEGTPTRVGGPTAQQAREFARTAAREAQIQMRLRGKG